MPNIIQRANLPAAPFDGQEFVDFRRIKWQFDKSISSWRLIGPVPDIPAATGDISGLLKARDKILLDSLPSRAGGFGIISRPLLSVVPQRRKALYKGIVKRAFEIASGSRIVVSDNETDEIFDGNEFAGKIIYFQSGTLKSQYFLIFTNDSNSLYLMGIDASVAVKGDKFEIYEATAINEDGVIQGPIELVSETIDITCVDGNGNPIDSGTCNVNYLPVDDTSKPPGLDFKVSENFKKQFCIVLPGAPGSRGDIGDKGPQGKHGTGDGPIGDTGQAGLDAPDIGDTFTGVKITDLEDIYDTAVVAMELDAAAGKLHVIKAKIRTPDNSRPADQVIASALSRDVRFTNSEFKYELIMPNGDPVGISDVEIMHYPQGFIPPSTNDRNSPQTTEANVIKLSALVDAMIAHYRDELTRVSREIDEKQIKPFIEDKDKEARIELQKLADEVARCEWGLQPEFCLGISPENCEPEEPKVRPFPLAGSILGPEWSSAVAIPLPPKVVPVTPIPPPGDGPPVDDPNEPPREPGDGDPPGRLTPNDALPPTTRTTIEFNSRPRYPEDDLHLFSEPQGFGKVEVGGDGTISGGKQQVSVEEIDGSQTLRAAGYVILYGGGCGRTTRSTWTAEVSVEYADEAGNFGTVSLTDSDEAALGSFDKDMFIRAQKAAPDQVTGTGFVLEGPGEARLSLNIEGHDGRGAVTVYPYQVFRDALTAPMEVTQIMARAPDGQGGMAMVTGFTGELDCPDCPDCGDVNVDCGDVDCPQCGADIVVASSTPASGTAGTSVTIVGSGFGSTTGTITFGGVTGIVTSWSDTQITVTTPSVGAGDHDVRITTSDSRTALFPNMWEEV